VVQEFPEAEGPVEGVDYGYEPEPGYRPTGLTVIAILAWVFGGLALCCLPFTLFQTFAPMSTGSQANPMVEVHEKLPWIKTFTLVSTLVSMVFSLLLVIGGIGVWTLRRWGWTLLNGYAVIQLISVVVQTVVNFAFIFPESTKVLAGQPGGEAAVPIVYASGGCGMIIGAVLPIAILIVINTGASARAKPPA
jgi:hypothetical protein